MSYTPINWQNGDTITAEKMNKMDNGWSYSSSSPQLIFNESVTTELDDGLGVGVLTYSTEISDGDLIVTYDGVDYECTCSDGAFGSVSESFEDYPFLVYYLGKQQVNNIVTTMAGTHTISVSTAGSATVEVSTEFRSAVNNCVDVNMIPFLCVEGVTTYAEAQTAVSNGRLLYFKPFGSYDTYIITSLYEYEDLAFIPTTSAFTASFGYGTFSIAYN